MLTTGIQLLVAGMAIDLLAFICALFNMKKASEVDTFDKVFHRHLGVMGAMAVGGLSATIGAVLIIVALVQAAIKAAG